MFCPNCGTEIPNGSKFCPKCGAQLNEAEEQQPNNSKSEEKPVRKHTGRIIAIIVAAVVVIAAIIVLIVVLTNGNSKDNDATAKETSDSVTVSSEITPTVPDGYVISIDEIPDDFIEQCENDGEEVILELVEMVNPNLQFSKINSVGYCFVSRDSIPANGEEYMTYLESQAKNGLCYMYECEATDKNGEPITGYLYASFDDLMKYSDNTVDFTNSEAFQIGSSFTEHGMTYDEGKNLLYDGLNDVGFTVNFSTLE